MRLTGCGRRACISTHKYHIYSDDTLWDMIHVFLAYAWLYSSTDATVHHSVPPVFGATSAPLDSPVRVSLVGPSLQVHSTLVSWGEPRFARFLKATWSAL